jgi:hypothetical protein
MLFKILTQLMFIIRTLSRMFLLKYQLSIAQMIFIRAHSLYLHKFKGCFHRYTPQRRYIFHFKRFVHCKFSRHQSKLWYYCPNILHKGTPFSIFIFSLLDLQVNIQCPHKTLSIFSTNLWRLLCCHLVLRFNIYLFVGEELGQS